MMYTAEKQVAHLSITDVVQQVRADSDQQDPALREYELTGAIRVCDLLSRTGVVTIPAIVYGGLKAEYDRIVALGNNLVDQAQY